MRNRPRCWSSAFNKCKLSWLLDTQCEIVVFLAFGLLGSWLFFRLPISLRPGLPPTFQGYLFLGEGTDVSGPAHTRQATTVTLDRTGATTSLRFGCVAYLHMQALKSQHISLRFADLILHYFQGRRPQPSQNPGPSLPMPTYSVRNSRFGSSTWAGQRSFYCPISQQGL